MAEEFDDCEFWLPPEFLAGDDFKKNEMRNSFLSSSPGESVVSVTDSESDEDDYINGLTRRMAHSTLDEDERHAYGNNKVWGLSGSPKSPLCSGLVGYGGQQGFRAITEEAGRKKMVEEIDGLFHSNNGSFAPLEKQNSKFGFCPTASQMSYQQLQAAKFEQLKREHMMKEQRQNLGVWVQENGGCGGELYQIKLNQQLAQSRQQNGARNQVGLSNSGWPRLQQTENPGSRMRAVFLGNQGATKERTGTGVFLPRRIGSTESRKNKQGCSTVLLPDRVVQALNLNLEKLNAKTQVHPRNVGSFVAYDVALKYGKNENIGKQRQSRENSARSQALADEVQLPPEWIY